MLTKKNTHLCIQIYSALCMHLPAVNPFTFDERSIQRAAEIGRVIIFFVYI